MLRDSRAIVHITEGPFSADIPSAGMNLPELRPSAALVLTVRHNAMYPRESRCLLYVSFSLAPRDCHACRTIAYCKYYDHVGLRDHDRLALAAWEDDGGRT